MDKFLSDKQNNDVNLSDIQNSGKQTGNDFSHGLNKESQDFSNKNKNEDPNNQNEIQYFEREISYEEETKLKNALTNHFIFQDLNEEIM